MFTFLGLGVSYSPRLWSHRIVFIVWVYYGFIVSVAYQGKLGSFLTAPLYEDKISSYKDINESSLTVLVQGAFVPYIRNTHFKRFELSKNSSTRLDMMKLVNDKNITMLAQSLTLIDMQKQTVDQRTHRQRLYTVPKLNIISYFCTFYVQKGHPLFKNVSQKLLYVHASGLPAKWLNDYLSAQSMVGYRDTLIEPMTISSLQVPGIILLMGYGLSFFIFFFENVYNYKR